MPKDTWARANARARYGPTCPRKSRHHGCKAKRKALKRAANPNRIASRCSPNTKLWFGRYKDTAINDIPPGYLTFLVANHKPNESWRIDGLVTYLRKFLKTHGPVPRAT